jgi:hypothetical protein
MLRSRRSALVVLAALAGAATACNMVAGIADYREVATLEPSSGGGNADAATGDAGDGTSGDASVDDGNAADSDLAPGCFTIAVIASLTGAYTGVQVTAPSSLVQPIPAGESRKICASEGDVVELHGQPDRSNALHRWDGTSCGTDGRCRFTVTGTMHVTVHLE